MSKTAIRNALFSWVAMMLVVGVILSLPEKVPAWSLSTVAGSPTDLRDLGGKPVGVLLYVSKVACGAHTRALSEAVQTLELLKDHPRYAVRVVYGEPSEAGARELAEGYPDTPILLDPGKRLASELGIDHYAVVLYQPGGRILELAKEQQLLPRPDAAQVLDRRSR